MRIGSSRSSWRYANLRRPGGTTPRSEEIIVKNLVCFARIPSHMVRFADGTIPTRGLDAMRAVYHRWRAFTLPSSLRVETVSRAPFGRSYLRYSQGISHVSSFVRGSVVLFRHPSSLHTTRFGKSLGSPCSDRIVSRRA